MSKTPQASKKLAQARLFLHRVHTENQKVIGKDTSVMEADISACLGAIKAALYRLKKEVGAQSYEATLAKWKGMLGPLERTRFQRMQDLRDLDVHETDIKTTVKQNATPAHLVPGVTVWGPPGILLPNPEPGGDPPFAPAWVIGHEVYVAADEAATACEKFLNLAERLVAEFQ
jgi:hypothetical protein